MELLSLSINVITIIVDIILITVIIKKWRSS